MGLKFGRGKDDVRVKRIRGSRAVYLTEDAQEVEIKIESEDGDFLTLRLKPAMVRGLVGDLVVAYEAICPPINRRAAAYSEWRGME